MLKNIYILKSLSIIIDKKANIFDAGSVDRKTKRRMAHDRINLKKKQVYS